LMLVMIAIRRCRVRRAWGTRASRAAGRGE